MYWLVRSGVGLILILYSTGANAANANERRIELSVPGAPWILTLPAGNFVMSQRQLKPDGRSGYFYLIDEQKRLNVSMYIEPVKDCKDSKTCRDMVWKLGNPAWINPQNVVRSEIGDFSIVEFLIPEIQSQPIKQQNMYAEFVSEGYWVDLHISKVLYNPEEHALFEQLVRSINFESKKNASP